MPSKISFFFAQILVYYIYFLVTIPHQKFGLEQKGTNLEEAEDNEFTLLANNNMPFN